MYLSDTNVISELTRREPNAGVLAWADTTSDFAISVVTLVTRNVRDFDECGTPVLDPFT